MIYDLIIIGGGPAGMTAGIYATRQRLKTLLITKDFGGQIAKKALPIENYPGFKEISVIELIQKFQEHLEKFEIDVKKGSASKIAKENNHFKVFTGDQSYYESRAMIIASGTIARSLEIPGEKDYIGKGVSYCAACDGPLFKDKIVAIIGGGNAGFEAALFLINLARKVYILEYGQGVKADKLNQERVEESGKVEIVTSASLKEIKGDKFVKSIVYKDLESQEDKTLDVDGVFVEIGYRPETSFLKELMKSHGLINELGEIQVNPKTCETKIPGLFSAGDVSDVEYKQVVIAAGEGAKAALSAYKYLKKLKK